MEVGTIFLWGKSTPPVGALELDGSTFDAEQYPELYDHLGTTTLPDMRGQFVRGWAHGLNVGGQSSRALLSTELATKVYRPFGNTSGQIFGPRSNYGSDYDSTEDNQTFNYLGGAGVSSSGANGIRVRPMNRALMFCIQAVPVFDGSYEERIALALEKIAEGVYHEEDVGEKKPLAKTIALLLAGLNINYAGD